MSPVKNVTAAILWLTLSAVAPTGAARDGVQSSDIEPPLTPDPIVVETISSMGDRTLVKLPKAKVTGEFNEMARLFRLDELGPEVRNFCLRMVYAPDRERALYFGANHGVPHKINDVWEYDLAANTWVLLEAPDFDANRKNKKSNKLNADIIEKNGIKMTENGNPVLAGHVFQAITYDHELKAMLFVSKHWGIGKPKDRDPDKYYGTWLWAFTPATREWKMLFANGPSPGNSFGSSLDYIPKLKKSLWSNGSTWRHPGSWLFDSSTNTWKRLPEKRDKKSRSEAAVVYAPDRDLMIAAITRLYGANKRTHSTYHFDLDRFEWIPTVEGVIGKDKNIPRANDRDTPFGYDLVSKKGILFQYGKTAGLTIWEYDPDKKRWSIVEVSKNSDTVAKHRRQPPVSYYDPKYNVHVLSFGRHIYLYRHRMR